MFNNNMVYLMLKSEHDNSIEVQHLETNRETQEKLNFIFDTSAIELQGKMELPFDGMEQPLDDEALVIHHFELPTIINESLSAALNVTAFNPDNTDISRVKAICIGNEDGIFAFQRFRLQSQNLTATKWDLFFSDNTFLLDNRKRMTITDDVDCLFYDNKLKFTSFYYARQVFDLSEYYREATIAEVQSFTELPMLNFNGSENTFVGQANGWIKKKIALIQASRVLEEYSPVKIRTLARSQGIEVSVQDNRIVFPTDKQKIKILLSFLDNSAWKGVFSGETYFAPSKRKINR